MKIIILWLIKFILRTFQYFPQDFICLSKKAYNIIAYNIFFVTGKFITISTAARVLYVRRLT